MVADRIGHDGPGLGPIEVNEVFAIAEGHKLLSRMIVHDADQVAGKAPHLKQLAQYIFVFQIYDIPKLPLEQVR